MTFDFIALLAVASILAGVGLITNNTVVIVASMLVSPIMGPVLGLTFGSRVQDWLLVRQSLINETLALLGCIGIGALVGLTASYTELAEQEWPTNEMQIRGELTGLLTGIAVAIPSGMGVCLSILGGNTSSLVGVAISASLLPPAVNTGICFVYAILLAVGAVTNRYENDIGEADYKDAHDFVNIGAISFALTVVNILCIWVSGTIMFEIKEVAPTQQKNAFWARDIKAAREMNHDKKKPAATSAVVDVSVLRQGVQTALAQKEDTPVGTIRFRPTPGAKRRRRPSSRLEPLGAALPLQPRRQHSYYGNVWPPTTTEKGHGDDGDDEEAADDNVRYVGLEDMAKLLGFDEEDDDDLLEEEEMYDFAGLFR